MGKIAVVFPGQGSQLPNMLEAWEQDDAYVGELIDEASDILHYDMRALLTDDPKEQLNQTRYTQPAILTCSYAIWSVLNKRVNCSVELMAGHSLGEYTALLCAGTLSFEQALLLVSKRGAFMQECVPEDRGGMVVVIGLNNDTIESICTDIELAGGVIAPANYNAIGQVVVAGDNSSLDTFIQDTKNAGAKMVKRLPVSVPSHCVLLTDAAEKLRDYLADVTLAKPAVAVLSNVDARHHGDPNQIKEKLCQQMVAPVQWVTCIKTMVADGITDHLEIGPNKVLTGLCKRTEPSVLTHTLYMPDQLDIIDELMS
jgi:[acyl-carrier-protein] S-malonyltransferase